MLHQCHNSPDIAVWTHRTTKSCREDHRRSLCTPVSWSKQDQLEQGVQLSTGYLQGWKSCHLSVFLFQYLTMLMARYVFLKSSWNFHLPDCGYCLLSQPWVLRTLRGVCLCLLHTVPAGICTCLLQAEQTHFPQPLPIMCSNSQSPWWSSAGLAPVC